MAGLWGCSVDKDYDLSKDIDTDMTLFPGVTIPVGQTLDMCDATELLGLRGDVQVAGGDKIEYEYILDLDKMGFDASGLEVKAEAFEIVASANNTIPLDLGVAASTDDGTSLRVTPDTIKAGKPDSPSSSEIVVGVTTGRKISEIKRIRILVSATNASSSTVTVGPGQGVSLTIDKINIVSGLGFSF